MLRPACLAAVSASSQRACSSSDGSSPSQRATPAEAVCSRGVAARTRSMHVDRLAEAAVREHDRERAALEPRHHVDLAQLVAPQRGGLLDQPVALALAAQHVERAEVVEVEHRDRDRRARRGGRGRARAAAPPRTRAASRRRSARRSARASPCARAGRRARSRRRPARRAAAASPHAPSGTAVDRQLPDHDQHAADLAVAQHRLEQRRARAGRVDQRLRERRVRARVARRSSSRAR